MKIRHAATLGTSIGLSLYLSPIFALGTLFYMNGPGVSQQMLNQYKQEANKINIIAPQVLNVTPNGYITGSVPQALIQIAHQHHAKVIPLAVNMWFQNPQGTQNFLYSPAAQSNAISNLVYIIKKDHLSGLQIDFENMPDSDRQVFTNFYVNLANAFHKNHLMISVAVYSPTSNNPAQSVYNLATLAKASNFVSIMTYGQHWQRSAPGPVAGINFDRNNIELALQYIPANKLSLGVPTYGTIWSSASPNNGQYTSYYNAEQFLQNNGQQFQWNSHSDVPYANFTSQGVNYSVYASNGQSFKDKYNLAKKFHLRSVSVWSFNSAAPGVWKQLPAIAS